MDSSEISFLKLRPDTVATIRKMYNLDKPGDMDKAIDALEEWLSKQYHMTKREYPRDFLERSIIFMKGSVERAKSQIENICSMRTIFPNYFNKYDGRNDFEGINSVFSYATLPDLTEDHYIVYILKFLGGHVTKEAMIDLYKLGMLQCEYIKSHDYSNGYVGIIDFRNISLSNVIAKFEFIPLQQVIKIIMEGYGMRVKGIHGVTTSKAIELLISLVKPVMSRKLANRLHVHASVETLYDHVPRNILPPEVGGYGESMTSLTETWKNVLGTTEKIEYMKEMSKAVSNQAYRLKEKLNALDLGVAGTFRTLNVD